MKRIYMMGMVAVMLAGNCLSSSAKTEKKKDGVLGAFTAYTQSRTGNFQAAEKNMAVVSRTYNNRAIKSDWNEEESENAERANEFIYEGETVWLNTEVGYYQSLAAIVRDIAYYYNGTYDLDLDLDHPFDRKEE